LRVRCTGPGFGFDDLVGVNDEAVRLPDRAQDALGARAGIVRGLMEKIGRESCKEKM
jgi:hypothetical protein